MSNLTLNLADTVARQQAELDSLRAQLTQAEAREKALREALESWNWRMTNNEWMAIRRRALGGGNDPT